MTLAEREALRGRLHELGFDEVRFATSGEIGRESLRAWLEAGFHGSMAWLERNEEKRVNPSLVQEGTQTLVLLGVNYFPGDYPPKDGGTLFARYSLYSDYHDTLRPGLEAAGRVLEESLGIGPRDYRYYVDTGPVLERAWAQRAGLGYVGRNAMLISRTSGNWLFLAAVLVASSIPPDEPLSGGRAESVDGVGRFCGKCTKCLDACPTQALVKPGTVDARRCISYLTIENKGEIPLEFREAIGNHLYGCDVCAEVCPWNRFAHEGRRLLLSARFDLKEITLEEILTLDAVRFAEVFKKTAIKRIKLQGLLRNACVVAGNSGDKRILPALVQLAEQAVPLVRVHAVWAVRRLAGADAAGLLHDARLRETEATVLKEYER